MAKKKEKKTNALRILEQKKVAYTARSYPEDSIAALDVAKALGQDPRRIFKTLVTVSPEGEHYVFCLPAAAELDLKQAARAVGEKKIEMLPQKELFPLTGYIHGGCSPVGMKKVFPTVMDESALDFETIFVSAGKIGLQMEIDPRALEGLIPLSFDAVARERS